MTRGNSELFRLDGRVAIVTGGGTGIGKQMAIGLAEAGSDIVLCSRRPETCKLSAEKIAKLGVKTMAHAVDVTKESSVISMVNAVQKRFGRIDILVNSSGTAWAAHPEDTTIDDWKKVIDTNLTGTFITSKAVGRQMIRHHTGGSIINISSIVGISGAPPKLLDSISYAASKGGINSLTKDLAVKWARYAIRVNALAPTFFRTHLTDWVVKNRSEIMIGRTPLRRIGGANDLKGPVVFLASDASKFVTGHILVVDGGWTSAL